MPIGIGVGNRVTSPEAVFARQKSSRRPAEGTGANSVDHVGQSTYGVVSVSQGGACRVSHVRQTSDGIITICRVSFGRCPTIGQSAIRVVSVEEGVAQGVVNFIGHAPVQIIFPICVLALSFTQVL